MIYEPTEREVTKLIRKAKSPVLEVLTGTPLDLKEPVPIQTEEQARKYLCAKVRKYGARVRCKGSDAEIVEHIIATAMNNLLGPGYTYANLYARSHNFLTEPHIAAALAFNALYSVPDVPDEVDMEYGLTYGKGK